MYLIPDADSDDEFGPLRCWDCNVNFTEKHYLYSHLYHHIKQPYVILERTLLQPLKITLKNKSGKNFEVINSSLHPSSSSIGSPSQCASKSAFNLAETKEESESVEGGVGDEEAAEEDNKLEDAEDEEGRISFSPNFAGVDVNSPTNSDSSNAAEKTTDSIANSSSTGESNASEYGSIPGAEPTPPPEPSPDYPKIRIKTTGLLKEPLTITEITDDNPDGDPSYSEY